MRGDIGQIYLWNSGDISKGHCPLFSSVVFASLSSVGAAARRRGSRRNYLEVGMTTHLGWPQVPGGRPLSLHAWHLLSQGVDTGSLSAGPWVSVGAAHGGERGAGAGAGAGALGGCERRGAPVS